MMSSLMPPILRAALPLLLLAACVAPPAATARVEIAPADTAPSPDAALVSVTAVDVPQRLVVDGDLAEWGSLVPRRDPSAAASRVAVAVTGDGARIAADLGEAAREGIWLGIGAAPAEVPPVGEHTQVRGGLADADMGVTTPRECVPAAGEAPPDPEDDPACRAFRRGRADFEAAHERRFRRFYRIDREGVRVSGDDGTLAAVAGAQVVWKPTARGATVEVSLPAPALPRLGEAPLARIRLVARLGTAKPPDLPAAQWVSLDLPAPVGFEPWAALRAQAFALSRGMSYQPGDPRHVEALRYPAPEDRRSVVASEETLYAKQATLGDVEVGYLAISRRLTSDDSSDTQLGWQSDRIALAVLRRGAVGMAPIEGEPRALVERDGALHLLAYAQQAGPAFEIASVSSFGTATFARWSAIEVDSEGKHRTIEVVDDIHPWDRVEAFHDAASFGLRGSLAAWAIEGESPGELVELRWRWDPGKKKYVGKRQKLDAPPAPKKTKKRP